MITQELKDYNGDGKSDILSFYKDNLITFFSNGDGTYSQVVTKVPGDWNINYVREGDYNGDGKSDILAHLNNKFFTFFSNGDGTYTEKVTTVPGNYLADYMWGGDYNGDGKSDILSFYKDNLITFFSNGDGTYAQKVTKVRGDFNINYVKGGDYNGDGKTDLLGYFNNKFITFFSNGDGSYTDKVDTVTGNYWADYVWTGDFNGDGKSDLLSFPYHNNGALLTFSLVDATTACFSCKDSYDVASTITSGQGAILNIAYKSITDSGVYSKDSSALYPYLDLKIPLYVVSQTQSSDGLGGNYTTNYTYVGAKLHLTGGGFLGFRQVAANDPQTGITTTTTYSQNYPYQGLPQTVEKRTASGVLLNSAQNTWQNTVISGTYHRNDLIQTVEQSWDLNGAALPRTKTNTIFDAYGNPTQITVATDDGYTAAGPVSPYGNVKTTANTYTNNTTNWLLGRLTRATVTSTLPSGAAAARSSAFAYDSGSGLLMQEVIEPDNAPP